VTVENDLFLRSSNLVVATSDNCSKLFSNSHPTLFRSPSELPGAKLKFDEF
jgi:hypothetical protein